MLCSSYHFQYSSVFFITLVFSFQFFISTLRSNLKWCYSFVDTFKWASQLIWGKGPNPLCGPQERPFINSSHPLLLYLSDFVSCHFSLLIPSMLAFLLIPDYILNTENCWVCLFIFICDAFLINFFLKKTALFLFYFFKTVYFVLGYNHLTMLWLFQLNSKGTQPYMYMYPFFSKLPSHPHCHITLNRVSCAL